MLYGCYVRVEVGLGWVNFIVCSKLLIRGRRFWVGFCFSYSIGV